MSREPIRPFAIGHLADVLESRGFDWDEGNRAKSVAHGVHRHDIEAALRSKLVIISDIAHSQLEERFQAIGRVRERYLFLVYTLRVDGDAVYIRPISARYLHAKEVRRYAEAFSEVRDR